MQDDLAEVTDNFMEDSTNTLGCFIDAARFKDSNTAVLSGISLHVDKVKAIVGKSENSWREPSVNRLVPYFTLIAEDSIFAKVSQSRTAELRHTLWFKFSRGLLAENS